MSNRVSTTAMLATADELAAPLATIEHLLAQRRFFEDATAQASFAQAIEDAYPLAMRLASELSIIRAQIQPAQGEVGEERPQARDGPCL